MMRDKTEFHSALQFDALYDISSQQLVMESNTPIISSPPAD